MGEFKVLPATITDRIKDLGQRIRVARTRRKLSIVELAAKAGIHRNTLSALESGRPGVAISAYVMALWALGLEQTLEGVAHPDADSHGRTLEEARLPKRVRKSNAAKDEYNF